MMMGFTTDTMPELDVIEHVYWTLQHAFDRMPEDMYESEYGAYLVDLQTRMHEWLMSAGFPPETTSGDAPITVLYEHSVPVL